MKIEYLEIFKEIEGDKPNLHKFEKLYKDRLLREDLLKRFSFAIPTEEAIKGIIKYSPIIEIGAGGGYWAYLIDKYGGEIVAFDNYSRDKGFLEYEKVKYFTKTWFNVRWGDEKTIDKYPNHTLFLCWIGYGSDLGYKALKRYKGKYFIYIGAGMGGCTANNEFFKYLNKNFKETENFYIPQWYGMHDYLDIYERIKK